MNHRSKISLNTGLSILLLLVFVTLLVLSISLVRTKMLQNIQSLGMSLARSYASEEEMHILSFRNFMDLGVQYVEEIALEDGSPEEIQ